MKTVIIASKNPVKIDVAKRAFSAVFPSETFQFEAVKSESGVGDQPMDEETRHGAQNRLKYILQQRPDADFWISQEGGLHREGERLFNRAWIVVTDKTGLVTESSTAQFYLPTEITSYIKQGMELGTATDKFFNTVNTKHGVGAIGYLTDGIIDRAEYYLPAAIIALSELKHRDWY